MADPIDHATFCSDMVAKYQTLLTRHAGKTSIVVDGISTSFADLKKEYQHWRRELDIANGTAPTVASVDMS